MEPRTCQEPEVTQYWKHRQAKKSMAERDIGVGIGDVCKESVLTKGTARATT
jgi:hypothetical protein